MGKHLRMAALWAAGAVGVTSCAYYDDYGYADRGYGPGQSTYGEYSYAGGDFGHRRGHASFSGSGADILDPWLAETREGRDIVSLGFLAAAEGNLDEQTADRANIWFRRYADTDRDMRLTDEEIRIALVQASRPHGGDGYRGY